jgi:hypothetical protein
MAAAGEGTTITGAGYPQIVATARAATLFLLPFLRRTRKGFARDVPAG